MGVPIALRRMPFVTPMGSRSVGGLWATAKIASKALGVERAGRERAVSHQKVERMKHASAEIGGLGLAEGMGQLCCALQANGSRMFLTSAKAPFPARPGLRRGQD